MNLLAKITLIGLCSFILFSCKYNQKEIGLEDELQGGLLDAIFTDTLSVKSTTMLIDTTSNSDILSNKDMVVGAFSDPNLGTTSAINFTQFNQESVTNPLIGLKAPVYDSLKFVLYYGGAFNGDMPTNFNLNLYRLTDSISSARVYNFASPELSAESSPVGSFSGNINFKNRGKDSLFFKMNDALGTELFSKFGSTEMSTVSNFVNYFKGLKLQSSNNNTMIGAGNMAMVLYFHDDSAKTTVKKFRYVINTNRFTKYSYNRGATVFNSLIKGNDSIVSSQTNNVSIIEGSSPLAIKIAISNIKNLKNAHGKNIAINKAILEFKNTVTVDTLGQPVIQYLRMYECDKNGKILLNSSSKKAIVQAEKSYIYGTSYSQFATYNSTTNSYQFLISDYVQAQLYDKKTIYFLVTPADGSGYGKKAVIGDNKHPLAPSKLKLYYTVIK